MKKIIMVGVMMLVSTTVFAMSGTPKCITNGERLDAMREMVRNDTAQIDRVADSCNGSEFCEATVAQLEAGRSYRIAIIQKLTTPGVDLNGAYVPCLANAYQAE